MALKPIEQAPRDGTKLILAEVKDGAVKWTHVGIFVGQWWALDMHGEGNEFTVQPTHFDWLMD